MFQKILTYFGVDGLLHLILSYIIAYILISFCGFAFGMLATMIIGIMKEIVDKFNNGTPSWKDIFSDVIGILLAGIIKFVF